MKIGVLSDSHGDKMAIDKAAKFLLQCDLIYHLGDNYSDIQYLSKKVLSNIKGVRGNCDPQLPGSEELIDEIQGIRVLLTHGHKWGVNQNTFKLRYKAMETNCKIILYGHTHIGKIEEYEGIFYINPGSISEARGRSSESIAIIEIERDNIIPTLISI